MINLNVIGGCLISSRCCAPLLGSGQVDFTTPRDLRKKLPETAASSGDWTSFRRFSPDAQLFVLCASIALNDIEERFRSNSTIGVVCADDFEHEADQTAYFTDYVEGGRQMGMSSLFVHTLPTSAAADASVCLRLEGPLLYLRDETDIWKGLLETSQDFIQNGDADLMLATYRKGDSMVCLTLANHDGIPISRILGKKLNEIPRMEEWKKNSNL